MAGFSFCVAQIFCIYVLSFVVLTVALDAPTAKMRAEFALSELKKLSDSGVYESLSLHKVIAAEVEDGIFHENTILKLELASPHFQSQQQIEAFDMVIMKHKDDGVRSLAIDEFPVMSEEAIETFWIQKVEAKKIEREAEFRRLEIQTILQKQQGGDIAGGALNSQEAISFVQDKPIADLLEQLDSEFTRSARKSRSADTQRRLLSPYDDQEAVLSDLSLAALYDISIHNGQDYSSYQIERARQIIDEHMDMVSR
eukprot:GSChrysophyteH1.ASY1.ANO1.28.1 assembled CDS